MRKLSTILVFVTLTGTLLAGCGGGDSKTVKIPGGGEVTTSDKLPSSFPDDFPIYDGAKVVGSVSGTSNGIKGTTVSWESGDSVDKVKDYYDAEFAKDSWKSNSNGTINDGAYWTGENKGGDQAFYAFATSQDGKTAINVTVGDKETASSSNGNGDTTSDVSDPSDNADASAAAEPTPGKQELPAEVKLDKNFPTDRVPLPSGARIITSSSFGSGNTKTFSIVFLTKEDKEKVAQYFSDEMPKHGWSDSYTANTDGNYFVTFTATDTSASGEALTISSYTSTDYDGYSEVAVSVAIQTAGG